MTVFRDYLNLVQTPRETYDFGGAPPKCQDRNPECVDHNTEPPELLEVILAGKCHHRYSIPTTLKLPAV